MAYRILVRKQGETLFRIGPAHASTAAVAFASELNAAVVDPSNAGIILMDDSRTDLDRYRPWVLHLNGTPIEIKV